MEDYSGMYVIIGALIGFFAAIFTLLLKTRWDFINKKQNELQELISNSETFSYLICAHFGQREYFRLQNLYYDRAIDLEKDQSRVQYFQKDSDLCFNTSVSFSVKLVEAQSDYLPNVISKYEILIKKHQNIRQTYYAQSQRIIGDVKDFAELFAKIEDLSKLKEVYKKKSKDISSWKVLTNVFEEINKLIKVDVHEEMKKYRFWKFWNN